MGGLYNAVLGDGNELQRGKILLGVLGAPKPGRFRDAWVERGEDDQPVIAIYTRNGGPNREGQAEAIESMRANTHYLSDKDDTFDNTYATFYFSAPREYRGQLAEWMVDPVDMNQRWQDAIANLSGLNQADQKALEARIAENVTITLIEPGAIAASDSEETGS